MSVEHNRKHALDPPMPLCVAQGLAALVSSSSGQGSCSTCCPVLDAQLSHSQSQRSSWSVTDELAACSSACCPKLTGALYHKACCCSCECYVTDTVAELQAPRTWATYLVQTYREARRLSYQPHYSGCISKGLRMTSLCLLMNLP